MVLSNCRISLIYIETSFHFLVQSILQDIYHIPEAPRLKSDMPMHDLIWKVVATRNDKDPIAAITRSLIRAFASRLNIL